MNLFQLRYFVTLAKMQHYTKAAHELCITQPSFKPCDLAVEAELGVALFEKADAILHSQVLGKSF